MSESKILKGRCKRTGLKFGMELKQIDGEWKVVNMIRMEDAMAASVLSEVRQSRFLTNRNLLPCGVCGGRTVGGCTCARSRHSCSPDMRYEFDCIYCSEMEIDYSRERTPYNSYAGVSNIPGAIKDSYGNPQGSEYDLAADGAFEGYRVVILSLGATSRKFNLSDPIAALEKKGFEVVEFRKVPEVQELIAALEGNKTQLWILADKTARLTRNYYTEIKKYFEAGHGVYFWGEENPYYQDVNPILRSLFGSSMSGNNRGGKVLEKQEGEGMPGIVADHKITTGIVNFFEGTTIATVDVCGGLEPLVYCSNRNIVTAIYDKNGCRAIVDGGYTRLYCQWDSAGTDRYVVNAAAWLANTERFGY